MSFQSQGFGHYAYKCQNKRIIVIRDDGEVELTNEVDLEGMPKLDDNNDIEHIC